MENAAERHLDRDGRPRGVFLMIPAAGRTRASDQTVWTTYHSFADGECVGGFIQRARKQWKERKNLRSAGCVRGLQQLKMKKEEGGDGGSVAIVKMGNP